METVVYEPAEDSFLLQKYVKEYAVGNVLEVGTGSGILAQEAAVSENVKKVLAVDIQPGVIAYCKKTIKNKKIQFLQSDLFANISKTKKFDTIIFNPPYLPADPRYPDITLDAGKKGYEVIVRFLQHVNEYLSSDGKILLLFSSLSRKNVIDDVLQKQLLKATLLGEQHISFETLYVYLIEKKTLLKEIEKYKIHAVSYFAKGKRGVVYRGMYKNKPIIIKAENPKAETPSTITFETQWLKRVNKLKIGPTLFFSTDVFLVMEYIEGKNFEEYIQTENAVKIKAVIKKLFDQMYILDTKGINKFEMNHPQKHIIVRNHVPVLLDFERCRFTEDPKNVTQFVQFVISRNIALQLEKKGIVIDKGKMVEKAMEYKKGNSMKTYKEILNILTKK